MSTPQEEDDEAQDGIGFYIDVEEMMAQTTGGGAKKRVAVHRRKRIGQVELEESHARVAELEASLSRI